MNLVKDDIKKLYRKYLGASIMSAVVMSIYSIVDSVAIGQSEGPAGSAALAVITPLYGIYTFLSILCGVGGAVLYGNAKGEEKHENWHHKGFRDRVILIGLHEKFTPNYLL